MGERFPHARVADSERAPGTVIERLAVDLARVNVVAIERERFKYWSCLIQESLQKH